MAPNTQEEKAVSFSVSDESLSPQEFLNKFKKKYGRAPRILHVGNIANNAYGNAKLLNEIGFDCDVLCHDYYHIMGCPEWDDADFEGEVADHFFPDWWSVNLKGYKRPKWFVQGPFKFCVKYIKAKRRGKKLSAYYYWFRLELERFMLCSTFVKRIRPKQQLEWLKHLQRSFYYLNKTVNSLATFICSTVMLLASMMLFVIHLAKFGLRSTISLLNKNHAPAMNHTPAVKVEPVKNKNIVKEYHDNEWLRKYFSGFQAEFKKLFPKQKYIPSVDDIILIKGRLQDLDRIFRLYDIVQAYATDPIYPMLINNRPYVAYEHGTIREIPFENTSTGKLTLMGYAKADAIIVTNADNLEKARYMQPDSRRVIHGYHRFDERKILKQLHAMKDKSRSEGRFGFDDSIKVFFAPARQSHEIKGNHKIIEAVSLLALKYPNQFKVVFSIWGTDVEKAQDMIADLGLSSYFYWAEPLGSKELMHAYRSVDCVLDQFILPCIGGLPVDVMAVGECPLISYLDDELMAEFYGETIPLFNSHTAQDIHAAMELVITRSDIVQEKVTACKNWFEKNHTHLSVVQKLVDAYQMTGVLDPNYIIPVY